MRGIWSIGAIFLLASISGAYAQVGTYIISATESSGKVANYSRWYELCTPRHRRGYHLSLVEYHLDGDRRCGAWADCFVSTQADDKICVKFRMQGHSERGYHREGVAESTMWITYLVTH